MAGWRTVFVSKPCKLSLKQLQLVYEPHEEEPIRVPLEDITVIVLETTQALMTTALLSKIAEKNIALFSCDDYHTPNGLFIPFHQHSRLSQIAHLQQKVKEPLKKRLWQKVIKQKLENQANCLKMFEIENSMLLRLKEHVRSGDSDHLEAYGARLYWGALFDAFKRDQKGYDPINAALNYGYAIVRGAVARSLVSYGLLPTFGIFHRSELNAYNLADDMIEPLRPVVDKLVKELALEDKLDAALGVPLKVELLNLLNKEMLLEDERVSLLYVCDVMAKTLVKSMREADAKALKLPKLL